MSWFSFFMSLSVCVTTAKQLVVTGSDTALRVSVYSVPAIARHQLLWIRASQLSFCLSKHILPRLRSALWLLHFQIACQISISVFRRGWVFSSFSMFLIDLKLCYIATEIWNEKENGLLYRMPVGTCSLTSCMSQGTESKIRGPTEVYLLKVML